MTRGEGNAAKRGTDGRFQTALKGGFDRGKISKSPSGIPYFHMNLELSLSSTPNLWSKAETLCIGVFYGGIAEMV